MSQTVDLHADDLLNALRKEALATTDTADVIYLP